MLYRGKPVKDSIIFDSEQKSHLVHSNTMWRHVICEPGDATRYDLLFHYIDQSLARQINQPIGSLIVTNLNLTGTPTSMFIRGGDTITWKTVQEGLHISSSSSCHFISLVIALLYNFRLKEYPLV